MNTITRALLPLILATSLWPAAALAGDPVVSGLQFDQRRDGSGILEIQFDLSDPENDLLMVSIQASGDGGLTWDLPCLSLAGDAGGDVAPLPGRSVLWDVGADLPDREIDELRIRVLVSDVAPSRDMVRVPAGSFSMGPNGDRQVTISRDFHMDRVEVLNGEFLNLLKWAMVDGRATILGNLVVMAPTGPTLLDLGDPSCEFYYNLMNQSLSLKTAPDALSAYPQGYDPASHPVKAISWHAAALFCNWLSIDEGLTPAYDEITWDCNGGDPHAAQGYRLPTEAEWEYAAGQNAAGPYPWGGDEPDCLRCNAMPGAEACVGWTAACGGLPAGQSPLGIQDLAGNVAEWCDDRFGPLAAGDWTDPVGPAAGTERVAKGGGFLADTTALRSDAREGFEQDTRFKERGFRLVRTCDNSHPSIPTLLEPAQGAILFDEDATLRWSCSDPDGDPLLYDLYLDGNLHAADLPDTSFLLSGLADGTAVEWRVLARDDAGFEQWSGSRSFERWERPTGEGLRFGFDLPFYEGEQGELLADHGLLLHEGLYHCFHIYEHAGAGPDQIGHMSSPDLRNWTRHADILPVAEGEDWEGWAIWAPQVIPNPDPTGPAWLMLYTGVKDWGRPQQIGVAYSEDLDVWWRADSSHEGLNPFYHPSSAWAGWDDSEEAPNWSAPCRDPFVFAWEGNWPLITTGMDSIEDGAIHHAVCSQDSFVFQGQDSPLPLLLRTDTHQPESPQLHPVQHSDGYLRWHLFYSGQDGTRHQSADSLTGGVAGWSGEPGSGDQIGGFGYTAAEVTSLGGDWVISQHIVVQGRNRYIYRFAPLDFDAEPAGAPVVGEVGGIEQIRGLNEAGGIDSLVSWHVMGTLNGHAFEHQPTWGDNPLLDIDRGYSSGMTGNSYLATYEKRPTPDWGGAGGPGNHYEDFSRTGWIRSDEFRLRRNRMSLLVGGGNDADHEFVALVRASDDRVLFLATGEDSHVMSPRVWDCESLRGEQVYLVVADLSSATMGCIAVDDMKGVEDLTGEMPGEAPLVDGPLLEDLVSGF